jgi:hypothetical protein
MKKIFMLLMIAALVLVPAAALGAVHNWTSDFNFYPMMEADIHAADPITRMDTWYTITPAQSNFQAVGVLSSDYNVLGGEYYLNDQTFASLISFPEDTVLLGSYLFKNNFFLGFMYENSDKGVFTLISPGYRFGWGEDGYIALSAELHSIEDEETYYNFDLDAIYFGDNLKFFGQLYSQDRNGITFYDLGLNYQFSETLTGGVFYNGDSNENSTLSAGLTWIGSFMLLDASVSSDDDDDSLVKLSAMFNANQNLVIGAQINNYSDDDSIYYLKARYSMKNDVAIKFVYQLPADYQDSALFLGYQKQF